MVAAPTTRQERLKPHKKRNADKEEKEKAEAEAEEERQKEQQEEVKKAKVEEENRRKHEEEVERLCKKAEEKKWIRFHQEEDGRAKERLRMNSKVTSPLSPNFQRRPPNPPYFSSVPRTLSSALLAAQNIENLYSVPYPRGIIRSKPELNQNAEKGKFR